MIEYITPQPGRPDPYCWICRGYGCDNPRQAISDVSTWSPERITPPTVTGEEPWSWLTGPAIAWWYSYSDEEAA